MTDIIDLNKVREAKSSRIKEVDSIYLDPKERANLVTTLLFQALDMQDPLDIFENLLFWDLICFSTEMLNAYALQSSEEELIELAKLWNSQIYSRHYSLPEGHECLGPKRDEHEAMWMKRVERIEHRGDEG